MKVERWPTVERVYHSALERVAEDRAAFLDEACGGDEELRREVESLLAYQDQAKDFIEHPAVEVAAELMADEQQSLVAGQAINHYTILSLLGAGGMGEVYLAQDTKLRRQVALKLLPAAFVDDVDRVRRFEQEARAASALNHPNILTSYEIGRGSSPTPGSPAGQPGWGGTVKEGLAHGSTTENVVHFIAMEYIDGDTLREKIYRERTPLPKLLKYLQQVAEGLAKAHAAGIVHRDLKPDNIMITKDGYAKVLDFGLAKLIEQPKLAGAGDATSGETATALMPQHSVPGMVRGTVGYMSPEQAQGNVQEIDQRSDIFSFGCILFEAATRRKAFEGKDTLDSLHKIVHAPTPQMKEINATAPDELQRIVRRCLAKEPEKRYQSIKDVAIELEELQQELKGTAELEYSAQPVSSTDATPRGDAQAGGLSASQLPVSTAEVRGMRPTTSAEYIVNKIQQHKTGAALIIVVLVVAIAGIAYGLYKFAGHKPATSLPLMKITKLTTTGNVYWGAISPDGKYLVYTQDEGGQQSIWVKQVATDSKVQIATPADATYFRFTFTHDSNYIYFNKRERSQIGSLYRMPTLGGLVRKVGENAWSRAALSPDEKRIAFIRGNSFSTETSLVIANSDGSGEQTLATRQTPDYFFYGVVAWSPDGKSITCLTGNSPARGSLGVAGLHQSGPRF